MKAVNAEVVMINKASAVIGVNTAVEHNLFRDSGWILAKILGNLPERFVLVQGLLDVLTIL